ncbi:hypothetical protein [Candidatus Tokpelaia sp.]|uniref:hypothetical protein n=1 Tax=Candidatus Tokpelaia sp. TaxID=2233777 RepID=UPI001238636C|nr:hypothetical protein [Candidatus Tokpelaia sp.]
MVEEYNSAAHGGARCHELPQLYPVFSPCYQYDAGNMAARLPETTALSAAGIAAPAGWKKPGKAAGRL